MFKWLLAGALAASLLGCLFYDWMARKSLAEREAGIARRRAELHQLDRLDRQVRLYQLQKDKLQQRIDVINQLRQNGEDASAAVSMIAALGPDAALVDSVAVTGSKNLVVNGRADSDEAIERLAGRLAASGKQTAPDHSFSLQVLVKP